MAANIPNIAFILGTRPEAIKLAPVIVHARSHVQKLVRCTVISTGQQADLVEPALLEFGLKPDINMHVMRPGQSLSELSARCLTEITSALRQSEADIVVVQGDTTSALSGALAAFYEKTPVCHVEAGLRTGSRSAPFPEEMNRQLISRIAELHFAPTVAAKAQLLTEGIDAGSIEVTGNTIVDALQMLAPRVANSPLPVSIPAGSRPVLVTAHRRENLGAPLISICRAIRELAATRSDLYFVFVTHPNPAAAQVARDHLADCERVISLPPLRYLETLKLLDAAWLVLTDSGGLQEEAPSFGKPLLILRNQTERIEGVTLGIARLVGTSTRRIVAEVNRLADSPAAYGEQKPLGNPYGDGTAAARIVESLTRFLAITRSRVAA